MKKVTLILVPLRNRPSEFYLVSDKHFKEGFAYDTSREEIIYYNGDYGDPSGRDNLKKVIAKPEQIGYVKKELTENADQSDYEISSDEINFILNKGGECKIEMEEIRTKCGCACHSNVAIMHFMACCNGNGEHITETDNPKLINGKVIISF